MTDNPIWAGSKWKAPMATASTLAPSPDPRWKHNDELEAPPLFEVTPSHPDWVRRARRASPYAISFSASLVAHLILVLAAALIGVTLAAPSLPLITVQGGMIETVEEFETLEIPLAEATGEAQAEDDASVASFAAIELDPGVMQGGTPEVALVDFSDRAVTGLLADVAGLTDRAGDGKSTEGDGEGGSGGEAAGEEGTEFFGVQATGSKFVFVCDCSRSMTGMKWSELNIELNRCLGALGPGKSFYVIFFDGENHPMFEPFGREPKLLDATAQNIDKARYWIANVSLGPNTSPFESMKFGANLEPDTMFLLTDGEFGDYTAPYMRDFNKKRKAKGKKPVVVHTIGFFSQKHQLVLERIAKDSGGTYKFVEGPQPVKPKRKSSNVIAPAPGPAQPVFGPGPIGPAMPRE
jgi:hypothetical protein